MLIVQMHSSGGLVGRLIRWQTRSRYSHVSLVWLDELTGNIETLESKEGAGVRYFDHDVYEARRKKGEIEWWMVKATPEQQRAAWEFARTKLGQPYDYRGVLKFLSRRKHAPDGRWFCSELVFAALEAAGVVLLQNTHAWEVAPGMLPRSPLLTKV